MDTSPAEREGLVLTVGSVIGGKYVLDRSLGKGALAELWIATNRATGAAVCMKLLLPAGESAEAIVRFRREAHAAARLRHRAIVRIFDLLELDSTGRSARGGEAAVFAIVMELLEGETLGGLLERRGKLPLAEALDLFLPILSALAEAHRASVVHRDLKPDNVFIARDPDGHRIPKVLDFGAARIVDTERITLDGALLGTPVFMSPEQATGKRRIDARSDVFAAGVLLYMMLTGKNPFQHEVTLAATIDAIVRRRVMPIADLSPEVWSVVGKALSKDPDARHQSAAEMSRALRIAARRDAESNLDGRVLDEAPPSEASPSEASAPAPCAEPARPRRALLAAGIGAAAALMLVTAVATMLVPRRLKTPVSKMARVETSSSSSAPTPLSSAEPSVETAEAAPIGSPPVPPTTVPLSTPPAVRPLAPRRPTTTIPSGQIIGRDPGF